MPKSSGLSQCLYVSSTKYIIRSANTYRWQLSSFSRISYVVRHTSDHGAYQNNNDFVNSAKTPRELIDTFINLT